MAKVEIVHHEQLILLPQYFQKLSAAEASERVYMWERININYNTWGGALHTLILNLFFTLQCAI